LEISHKYQHGSSLAYITSAQCHQSRRKTWYFRNGTLQTRIVLNLLLNLLVTGNIGAELHRYDNYVFSFYMSKGPISFLLKHSLSLLAVFCCKHGSSNFITVPVYF